MTWFQLWLILITLVIYLFVLSGSSNDNQFKFFLDIIGTIGLIVFLILLPVTVICIIHYIKI